MAKKIEKTNAARLLDKAGISYKLIPYEFDENDLAAQYVADSLGQDIARVFKTLVLHGDRTGHIVCVVAGNGEADPMLWQEAYRKGVLIATEQTIMPFLKIMQLTWNKFQHDTNTQKITAAAQNMIDRVASFYDSYAELGRKLKAVSVEYNKGITKLQDNGQSITTSARQVISIGVRRSKGKEFNVPEEMVEIGEE